MMAEDESERGNSSRAERDIAGFKHIGGKRGHAREYGLFIKATRGSETILPSSLQKGHNPVDTLILGW